MIKCSSVSSYGLNCFLPLDHFLVSKSISYNTKLTIHCLHTHTHTRTAVKANNDPLLLSLFVSFGMGFDCASGEEIRQVLELGALPDSIVFAHPWKMSSHLRFAGNTCIKKLYLLLDMLVKRMFLL